MLCCLSHRSGVKNCQVSHHSEPVPEFVKQNDDADAQLRDRALFKRPRKNKDCPICFLLLPEATSGKSTATLQFPCCGKIICRGCDYALFIEGNETSCPFCRSTLSNNGEDCVNLLRKRVERNDPAAMFELGTCYFTGELGVSIDQSKGLELWLRAGELGLATAYMNIGLIYKQGRGVENDETKSKYYYELAAIGGNVRARHHLGWLEAVANNVERAIRHYMIAAECGNLNSVMNIEEFYHHGLVTKNEYKQALLAYQEYIDEVKSEQRDKAAAFDESYKYLAEEFAMNHRLNL
eukprot:scaffold26333_cov56-Cyclotella_meneghiniana.AAC.1